MSKYTWVEELNNKASNLLIQIACIVIDSIFLSLWVVAQYLVSRLIEKLGLSGIDQWTFMAFQVIFALSTLAPVIINIYRDIRVMIVKAQKQIEKAQLDETHTNHDK